MERISSVALLRRLGHDSRKNKLYRAFRELGRAVRTIVLLRYLSDPALRNSIAVVTNRMEAFHSSAQWLSFGGDVLADNDPDHQDKLIKLNELMANCVIYNTTLDITDVVNDLVTERAQVERVDLATIPPTSPPRSAASATGNSTSPRHRQPCSAASPCPPTTKQTPRDDRTATSEKH